MLTSILKRVDVAAYNFFEGMDGGALNIRSAFWASQVTAIGYALDEFNADLVTEEMLATVTAAGNDCGG